MKAYGRLVKGNMFPFPKRNEIQSCNRFFFIHVIGTEWASQTLRIFTKPSQLIFFMVSRVGFLTTPGQNCRLVSKKCRNELIHYSALWTPIHRTALSSYSSYQESTTALSINVVDSIIWMIVSLVQKRFLFPSLSFCYAAEPRCAGMYPNQGLCLLLKLPTAP